MGGKNHADRSRLLDPDYLRYMATDWVHIRESFHMTRAKLADKIKVSRPTMQHLEEHIGTPRIETVVKLIEFWESQNVVIPRFELVQVNKSENL